MNSETVIISKREYDELKQKAADGLSYMRENQIMHSDVQVAAAIQKGMIPGIGVLIDIDDLELYGDMDPALEVGGDFYDYFYLDSNHLFFCIGDVSGKGVPSIMYMVAAKVLLKNTLQTMYHYDGEDFDIEKAFEHINIELYSLTKERQFVTLFGGVLDLRTKEITCINAGHTRSIVIKESGVVSFLEDKSGVPLGSYYNRKKPEKTQYHSFMLKLEAGDTLFMYTDGCSEASNREGVFFGEMRMRNSLETIEKNKEIGEVVRYMQRKIIEFENHEVQDDDFTVLALKIK